MRVKLQYSVELDEVPDTVANLIQDEADRLSYCDHAIQSIVESLKQEEPHVSFVIDKIDKVRQTLGAVDIRLAEMENLITGYAHAVNPPQPQQPLAAPPIHEKPPADAEAVISGKVDPETGSYNYKAPYGVPDDIAEDHPLDGEQK